MGGNGGDEFMGNAGDEEVIHGAGEFYYCVMGEGWRIECACGWVSEADRLMENVGWAFDKHLEETR